MRSPDPQGTIVFSQQRTKKPPPQTQSPRSHLPSLSGRASLGASVPKGLREWPPGLWLSAAWPDGPWPWPARPGSRPGRCLPPPSTRPWPKCECWLPLPRGRARGRAQVLRTRPRTEQPATSLSLPLGYTPENILQKSSPHPHCFQIGDNTKQNKTKINAPIQVAFLPVSPGSHPPVAKPMWAPVGCAPARAGSPGSPKRPVLALEAQPRGAPVAPAQGPFPASAERRGTLP